MSNVPFKEAYRNEQALLAQQCNDRWIAHRKEHELESKALALQAKEYERRLEDLNGEHAKLEQLKTTYVNGELYRAEKKENDKRILDLEIWKSNMMGRAVVIGSLLAIFSSLLGAVLLYLVQK